MVAGLIADSLALPLLSLDVIKESLGDSLGLGDAGWSDRVGDAAAEVIFRLAPSFPGVVAEGWWRRARRDRAITVFSGWIEVFCHCDPDVVEQRMRARLATGRHPIHRDVIEPALLDGVAETAAVTQPLELGAALVKVETTAGVDADTVAGAIRAAAIGARVPGPR